MAEFMKNLKDGRLEGVELKLKSDGGLQTQTACEPEVAAASTSAVGHLVALRHGTIVSSHE